MKSFIILLLSVLLGTGAYLSRPSQSDFKNYVVQQANRTDGNFIQRGVDEMRARHLIDSVVFKDRIFWMDVQKDGKTIYTGVFSRWFDHGVIRDEVEKLKS